MYYISFFKALITSERCYALNCRIPYGT